MGQLGTYDKVLQYASDLLNAVREFVTRSLNIDLPMWLAQAIVLALFVPILFFGAKRAWKTRTVAKKIALWATCIVAGAVSLLIVATWLTYWRTPLLEQLEGEISGLSPEVRSDSLRVELLDFREQALGARVRWLTGTPRFLLHYTPEFADPPRLIRVMGGPCTGEQRLRPNELRRGAVVPIFIECHEGP